MIYTVPSNFPITAIRPYSKSRVLAARVLTLAFSIWLNSAALSAQQPPQSARLQRDEQLGQLHFTVRANYVIPQSVTVTEGWYQIHLHNPNGVASKRPLSINDNAGKALAVTETKENGPKSTLVYKFGPGKHSIRLDENKAWQIDITVEGKK